MKMIPELRLGVLYCSALLFGGGALTAFGIFLFLGPFRIVDMGMTEMGTLCFDTGLSLLFFMQHSLMVRQSFRSKMGKIIPEYAYPGFYALASGMVLIAVVILWQPSDIMLAQAYGIFYGMLRVLFLISVTGFFCAYLSMGSFDPFGTGKIRDYLHSRDSRPPVLACRGIYTKIRHPFYFFTLLMIWTYPYMTGDRLLFNILWSLWIIAGTVLEERDLVQVFGDEYRAYQKKTRMLIPAVFQRPVPRNK